MAERGLFIRLVVHSLNRFFEDLAKEQPPHPLFICGLPLSWEWQFT
jgi:hypothetical protein